MPSIQDWASRCAERIVDEYPHARRQQRPSVERIAAIIATFAEPLLTLLQEARREHYKSETDDLNDCPMRRDEALNKRLHIEHACDCSAEEWNRRIEEALK